MTGALLRINIRGRARRPLAEKWAEGARTYFGLIMAGFPKLFVITGPGSPSVLTDVIVSIEQHVEWISRCLTYMREHKNDVIGPTQYAGHHWLEHVNEVADKTLFPLANSWYMGANIPGKPLVFLPYVGGLGKYTEICEEIVAENYKGFTFG